MLHYSREPSRGPCSINDFPNALFVAASSFARSNSAPEVYACAFADANSLSIAARSCEVHNKHRNSSQVQWNISKFSRKRAELRE